MTQSSNDKSAAADDRKEYSGYSIFVSCVMTYFICIFKLSQVVREYNVLTFDTVNFVIHY